MSKRYFFCTAVLLVAAFFTSCENFLKAKDVKDEVEDIIAYNNAKIVKVNLFCEKDMGTIYPESSYNARLGYAFELQYVPNTENYIIRDESPVFEAVNRLTNETMADCVEISREEQSIEDKRVGLYKVKVKVVKSADDIMIRPCPVQIPKVIDIFPPNNVAGYPQDSTIRITFNKPVNTESFGSFSGIKILNSSNKDMSSYYGTPYFSNDNTILNISAAPGKSIIQEGAANDFDDITINIDFTGITDEEGIPVAQNNAYTFRVNKNIDIANPVLNSLVVKTTYDTSASYYRTLTDKAFDEWTETATSENPYGDFSQNHAGKTIYIELSGYDKDSGVNGIQVVETFYKTVDGDDTSLSSKTGVCGINKRIYLQTDNNNNNIYAINDTYTLVSASDGVFKLDISVLDNAGHASAPLTYYVIKDSSMNPNANPFLETRSYAIYEPDDPTSDIDTYIDIFSVARTEHNGSDNVSLTLSASSGDPFYKTYLSACSAEVFYGSSVNAINTKASKANERFSFDVNSQTATFVKIIYSDDIGNQTEVVRVIPPKPSISSYTTNTIGSNKMLKIFPVTDASYSLNNQIYGVDSSGFFYVVRNNTLENTNFGADPVFFDGYLKLMDYYGYEGINTDDKNFDVFIVSYYKYGNTYWCSVLSDDYVNMDAGINASGNSYINGAPTSSLSINGKTQNLSPGYNGFGPYTHDECTITIVRGENNSECSKVTVSNYLTPEGENPNLTFTYLCEDLSDNTYYYFSEPEFYLKGSRSYKLYIIVEDDTSYYKTEYFWAYVNGASEHLSGKTFEITDDTFPPVFSETAHDFTNDSPLYWSESCPVDGPVSPIVGTAVGLLETYETSGVGVMDYYFIPDSKFHTYDYTSYTMQDLAAYEKNTITFNLSDSSFKIPFNHLDDGLYTLCLVAKDWNGNYAIKCAPAFNKVLDIKAPVILKKINTSTLRFSSDVQFKLERYLSSSDSWTSYNVAQSTNDWGCPFSSTSTITDWFKISGVKKGQDIFDSGFYLVDYVYFPYQKTLANPNLSPLEFTNKEIIECLTGYHVYCNHPVLIHTMYCEKKLTETTTDQDAALWETKGFETGFIVKSGDYSYTNENYKNIPKGNYYTTIFHLPDGETIMTPIKQK